MERIWLKQYPPGVPADIEPTQYSSLVDLLEESFSKFADRKAFICMDKSISYRDLDQMSVALAAYLQGRGLQRGARVALMMPNVLQYPVATAAVLRAGFAVVNVNPLYTPRELEHQLKDSGAEAIIVLENFAHTVEQVIAKTQVKHVIVASMGDLLGFKGVIVNLVVRRVKKMVPAWSLPGAVSFNDCVIGWPRRDVQQTETVARRRRLPAIYGRHHRRLQGRHPAPPQHRRQRVAERRLAPAGDSRTPACRSAHDRLRAATLPHLRADGLLPARGARRRL
ncbi:acyl-CoA synthetase (AMP-forming)/AMP-acid ligase II [Bradyrhizobium sp. LM3.2]